MQVARSKGFEKRAQYLRLQSLHLPHACRRTYPDLKEVVFLAIANFVMFPTKKNYKSDLVILDRESYEHDLKDFSFTFLELSKFTKDLDHLETMIEKWAYFFKYRRDQRRRHAEIHDT